jgi:multidrug efflux pump subunit AcrA (membrane-fusion protein)
VISLAIATICLAHEGHQPLPTRGVQVEVAKGKVTLSDSSRQLPGVETTTVSQGQLVQRLPAPASVVVPRDRQAVVISRVAGRVEKLFVRPGDTIHAGDPIAELRSPGLD